MPPFLSQKEGWNRVPPLSKIASVHYTTSLGTSGYVARHVTEERNGDYVTAKRGGDINAVSVAEVATRDGLIAHFILAEEKTPMDFPPPKAFLHPSRGGCHATLEKSTAASIL